MRSSRQARADYPERVVRPRHRRRARGRRWPGAALSRRPGIEAASPSRYEIDPDDLLRLTIETDDADEVFWGIVHSHTHTPAVPSPTDVGLATIYREPLYLLVSLSDDEADPATGGPSLRAWRIVDGERYEVELGSSE